MLLENLFALAAVLVALSRLRGLAPLPRLRVINACAATVLADDSVAIREAEILRAICDTLDCPLPPLLPPTDGSTARRPPSSQPALTGPAPTAMETYVWLTLLSSLFHAFSFTWTRRFSMYSQGRVKTAFYSQFSIGLLTTLMLPFIGLDTFFADPVYPLIMAACVIAGQVLYIEAMRRSDATFVVPLLSIKIFGVAILSALILNEVYGPLVYLGGLGVVVGVFYLNNGTFRGSLPATLMVLLASLLFAGADTIIILAMRKGYSAVELAIYTFTLPALILAPLSPILFRGDWKISKPFANTLLIYAVTHLCGAALLMYAFSASQQVTIVNIVQSVRGLLSIGVVYLMGMLGVLGVERLTRSQLQNRLLGSVIMCVSLTLAVLAR